MSGVVFAIVGVIAVFSLVIFKIFMPKKPKSGGGGFSPGYNPPVDDVDAPNDIVDENNQPLPIEDSNNKKK
jgi:hypothetical protein